MVHGDPRLREARLAEVLELLGRAAAPEDRDLLLAFAPVVFAELPARLALEPARGGRRHAPSGALPLRRARDAARASGLRRVARDPRTGAESREAEARALGGGEALPLESTILETHTVDQPFIFESLKNYLQKQGLRVFSAIHPVIRVGRRWERIVSIGGPLEEGNKESFCFFQIEPVESPERLRRMEHEVFSLLKAVFAAIDGFDDMCRACRALGGAPAQPQRRPFRARPGAGVPGLAARRQLRLHGHRLVSGRT